MAAIYYQKKRGKSYSRKVWENINIFANNT